VLAMVSIVGCIAHSQLVRRRPVQIVVSTDKRNEARIRYWVYAQDGTEEFRRTPVRPSEIVPELHKIGVHTNTRLQVGWKGFHNKKYFPVVVNALRDAGFKNMRLYSGSRREFDPVK
jgi:hypothetical protein